MVSNSSDHKHKARSAGRKKRVGKTRRLNTLMPKLLGPVMHARGLTVSRIITEWPRLAGDSKDWSEPHSLKFPAGKTTDGSLTVNVASGRGPEMQMMTQEVISRINQLFGYRAVSRIVITQTAMHVKKPAKQEKIVREWSEDEKTAFRNRPEDDHTKASPELQKALDNLGKSLTKD